VIMPTRRQVRDLVHESHRASAAGGDRVDAADYGAAADRLGIPPGRAYLIATGVPADGSPLSGFAGPVTDDQDALGSRAQALVNSREVNPISRGDVHAWIRRRAFSDASLRTSHDGGRS
jgi:hypothetical protein